MLWDSEEMLSDSMAISSEYLTHDNAAPTIISYHTVKKKKKVVEIHLIDHENAINVLYKTLQKGMRLGFPLEFTTSSSGSISTSTSVLGKFHCKPQIIWKEVFYENIGKTTD